MMFWVAGGTFALYSLLKRQAEEGKARSDRMLRQYNGRDQCTIGVCVSVCVCVCV